MLLLSFCIPVLLPVASQGATEGIVFGTGRQRFLDTEDVPVSLVNNTGERIELFGGGIYSVRTGAQIVALEPSQRFLRPGDEHQWVWVNEGRAGRFEARFKTSEGRLADSFEKGAFFTLGFEGSEHSFSIWVREAKPIEQLRTDLSKPQNDRRIVSGIVSRERGYNPEWSYTMGPGSIVLGEVFIEVCDASPAYVEENRAQWMGERWCPWSSYVATEGR